MEKTPSSSSKKKQHLVEKTDKSPAVTKPQGKKVTKPVKESSSEDSSESEEDEPPKPVSKPATKVSMN